MEIDDSMVSKIIVKSCKINPSFDSMKHLAWNCRLYFDPSEKRSRFLSGSNSEFFIEPSIPDIGDLDFMDSQNDEVVILENSPEFGFENKCSYSLPQYISILRTEKNSCPLGYYNFRYVGKLIYNWNDEKYDRFEQEGNCYRHLYFPPIVRTKELENIEDEVLTECRRYIGSAGPSMVVDCTNLWVLKHLALSVDSLTTMSFACDVGLGLPLHRIGLLVHDNSDCRTLKLYQKWSTTDVTLLM